MNTLKISLEYRCYPIWEYSEDGDLIDNDLPEELLSDKELDELLLDIQNTFNSLFVDTPKEFFEKGFDSEEERAEFVNKILLAESILKIRYGDKYIVDNQYTEESFK